MDKRNSDCKTLCIYRKKKLKHEYPELIMHYDVRYSLFVKAYTLEEYSEFDESLIKTTMYVCRIEDKMLLYTKKKYPSNDLGSIPLIELITQKWPKIFS